MKRKGSTAKPYPTSPGRVRGHRQSGSRDTLKLEAKGMGI